MAEIWKPTLSIASIPKEISRRDPKFGVAPAWSQIDGSCECNAFAKHIQYFRRTHGLPDFEPARAFINWNGRAVAKKPFGKCDGVSFEAVWTALMNAGVCPEYLYPYTANHLLDTWWGFVKVSGPTPPAYTEAARHKVLEHALLYDPKDGVNNDLNLMKLALAEGNTFPTVVAYWNHLYCVNGILDLPPENEMDATFAQVYDAHSVIITGYNANGFEACNSYGDKWDGDGFFIIPERFARRRRCMLDMSMIVRMSG